MIKKLLSVLWLSAIAGTLAAQTVTFSVPVAPCHSDGVITASVTGMTPPLTVTWVTHGTTAATIVHTVTGTSDGLTTFSGGPVDVYITDGTLFTSASYAASHAISYAASTSDAVCPALGTASAMASGGTAPYIYKWFDKTTGSVIASGTVANLPTGNYGLTITDAAGCEFGSKYVDDTIAVGYVSYSATVSATAANCTDGTGSVDGVDPAAVLPISYRWSNGATSATVSGLSKGHYTVEIVDAAGCKASAASGVYTPYSIDVAQTTTITTSSSATPATCTSADGSVSVAPSGGTAPYTFSWSNGAVTAGQGGLASGAYFVTVTDVNGCTAEDVVFVGATSPITAATSSAASLCTSATGNASVMVSGGTAPYNYYWYTTPVRTTSTAAALPPGDYRFKVTDAMGCTSTGTVTIPPVNIISAAVSSTSPLCMLANGSLSVTPTGGVAPYTYSWSTGAATPGITSVPAGSYSLTITDAMGCKIKPTYHLNSYSTVGIGMSATYASCIFAADGSIIATAFGGTAPYSYTWTSGATTATLSGLASGHYWVTATDASGCKATQHAYLGYDTTATSCFCTIEGTVYGDANGNCFLDGSEAGVPHVQVLCSGVGYTYTDANGHYSFKVPAGSYTITETLPELYALSPCQLNGISVTAASGGGCVNIVDFANSYTPAHNLRISTSTIVPPVPGHMAAQRMVIVNEGTLSEDSVFTSFRPDGQLLIPTFVSAGVLTGSNNYYTNTSSLISLEPGKNREFTISYNTPANIPLSAQIITKDTVAYNAEPLAWLADNTPANNVCQHSATVVSAFDPNFKEVTPRGIGANGIIAAEDSVLEYSIHFRNTGSSNVQDVTIVDTLDNNVEWTSLHPVYQSAPCQVSVVDAGTKKVATFTFHNINLPSQMTDDLRSNGMITYTIHTKPGLALGAQIRNRASIYFDYHEPVTTNTTLNTIGNPGSVSVGNNTAAQATLMVFPNPADNSFHTILKNETAGSALMTIADVTGKVVLSKNMELKAGTQSVVTDITGFTPGVYFVTVSGHGRSQTAKLIVVR